MSIGTNLGDAPQGWALTVHALEQLQVGDLIRSHGETIYHKPLLVAQALAPIATGSPVMGVRVQNRNPSSDIEWVLYPSQMDGYPMTIERQIPGERTQTMTFIARTGNLVATPTLRQNEAGGYYTYARVASSDRIRQADGTYTAGPPTFYNISVSGSQAVNLVKTAQDSGNIRLLFAGTYRVTEYTDRQGVRRIQHEVRADDIGVSFIGQNITAESTKKTNNGAQQPTQQPVQQSAAQQPAQQAVQNPQNPQVPVFSQAPTGSGGVAEQWSAYTESTDYPSDGEQGSLYPDHQQHG